MTAFIIALLFVATPVSWILLSKLFEKFRTPESRSWLFYSMLLLYPALISAVIAAGFHLNGFAGSKADLDSNWLALCQSIAPYLYGAYILSWTYGCWSLKKKNEIVLHPINRLGIASRPVYFKTPAHFAFYFSFGALIFVLPWLPWALI